MIPDYIVVEQVCESCGVINDHTTAHCPNEERAESTSLRQYALSLLLDRASTFLFIAGQFAR